MEWRVLSVKALEVCQALWRADISSVSRRSEVIRCVRALEVLREPAAIAYIGSLLFEEDPTIFQAVETALVELFSRVDAVSLPYLEQQFRAGNAWALWPRHNLGVDRSYIKQLNRPGNPLLLGLASFNPNGYIRQEAVVCLDKLHTSGKEISFLLLRLDDWVPAVREAAEKAIVRRLHEQNRGSYLENLALLACLQVRTRSSRFVQAIESLLKNDIPAVLEEALSVSERKTQRYGIALAWSAAKAHGSDQLAAVFRRMVASRDPMMHAQAARRMATDCADPDLSGRLLPALFGNRLRAVRLIALTWCVTHDAASYIALLEAGLLDSSAPIRSIAQFYLPKLKPIDLRAFYRDALSCPQCRVVGAALSGLAETGSSSDASLILPLVAEQRIAIRRTAVAALGKLSAKPYINTLIAALEDPSPAVSRQARQSLEPFAMHIAGDILVELLCSTAHSHVPLQALALINRLSKWQKLPLLIDASGHREILVQERTKTCLKNWLVNFNKIPLQPTRAELVRARTALLNRASYLTAEMARELGGILQSTH